MSRLRRTVTHHVHGIAMGSADVMPGISGGTVALVAGIYERLIDSIRAGASGAFALARLNLTEARRELGRVDWGFIVPLGLGIGLALYLGSKVVPTLLDAYPVQVRALFFGLILGSLSIPLGRMRRIGREEIALMAFAAILAFVLVGLPPREIADPPYPMVFAFAAIAICAMILPGVSGAYLLVVLGIYEGTLHALSSLDLVYVAVFGAGAAVGLAIFSGILGWLLDRHHELTMAALVGLMAGSLRALWPWLTEDRGLMVPPDPASLATGALLALLGVAALLVSGRNGRRRPDAARR